MKRFYLHTKVIPLFVGLLCLTASQLPYGQVIYQHDFGTATLSGNRYAVAPWAMDNQLSNSEWVTSYSGFTELNDKSGKALPISGYNFPNTTIYRSVNDGHDHANKQVQNSSRSHKNETGDDEFSLFAGNPDDHFRSAQTGDWNEPASWQSSPDGTTNWSSTTIFPDSLAKSITINDGHTITLTADASARLLTIEPEGIIANTDTDISGGYQLIIVKDGTTDPDFNIKGTYILLGNMPVFRDGATAIVYTGGLVRADDNDGDKESEYFASSSSVFFQTNAYFEWNNTKNFYADTTYFPKSGIADIPVFKFSQDATAGNVTDALLVINGILAVDAQVTIGGVKRKIFRNGITGNGTLRQNSSAGFDISGQDAILGGQDLILQLKSGINLQSSVTIPQDSSVTITGARIVNSTAGSTLNVDGTLDMADQAITNSEANMIIGATGTYRTAHPGGFTGTGSSIPADSVSLEEGSTVEIYASDDQDLKARDDFSNLIFSGGGIKTVSSGIAPNGTITIKGDVILDATGHNIGGALTSLTMLDNSRLIVGTSLTQPRMEKIYNLTGGTIEFAGSNNATRQPIRGTDDNGNIIYHHIEVSGTNVGNSNGNIILKDGGTFTVKSTGQLTINNNSIKGEIDEGNYTITLETGSLFRCGNNEGFHGFSSTLNNNSSIDSNITNITVMPGTTIEYTGGPNGAKDQNISNANDLEYSHLILSGSSTKTAPSDTLIVNGNFIKNNDGIFVHNEGTILFSGNSEQSYEAEPPYPQFFDVINNNTSKLFIQDTLAVDHLLRLGIASRITLDGDVIIRSTDQHTARIDKIPSTASIVYASGAFVVERYIAAHSKAWQLLSVPTKGSSIFDSWQNKKDHASGRGVTIPGDFPDWDIRGFDGLSNSPAMKKYDPISDTFVGIENTSQLIENPNGYFLFVRGDRNVTYEKPQSVATTLHARGSIYEPSKSPPEVPVPANNFQMVGNPYASAINFDNIQQTNVDESYYVWDHNLGGGYGYGGYRTISGDQIIPSGGNYQDDNIPPIQSGQAFFVKNSGSTVGTLTFNENAKVDSSRSIFRTGHTTAIPDAQLRVNLLIEGNSSPILLDGVITLFKSDYALPLDRSDARKLKNSGENISLLSQHHLLAIERRPMVQLTDTLFYQLEGLNKRNYQLQLGGKRLDYTGLEAFLADNYLHTLTPVQANGTTPIDFTVDSDPASNDPGRFYIIFREVHDGLPVNFTNITAQVQEDNILVNWNIENPKSISDFVIESSTDGVHFSTAGTVAANSQHSYKWIDLEPAQGIHFYRIKGIEKMGKATYSIIVNVSISAQAPGISLYPNPVINPILQLRFIGQPAGKYKVRLAGSDGKLLLLRYLEHPGGNATHTISINQYLANGVVQVEIKKPDGTRKVIQIIINH